MTPEAKAREISDRWFDRRHGEGSCHHSRAELAEHLLPALRDVERETLERASKIAEDMSGMDEDGFPLRPDKLIPGGRRIAQSIRSLLQKE